MSKRVVDYDPFTGVTTTFDYDPNTDTTYIGREQLIQPALDRNKALQNDTDYSKQGIKNDWWHEAFIPNIIIEKWKQELGVDVFNRDHIKKVKRLLNSPEYKYLKTTAGTV